MQADGDYLGQHGPGLVRQTHVWVAFSTWLVTSICFNFYGGYSYGMPLFDMTEKELRHFMASDSFTMFNFVRIWKLPVCHVQLE